MNLSSARRSLRPIRQAAEKMSLLPTRPSAAFLAVLAAACRPSDVGKHQPVQSDTVTAAGRPSVTPVDSAQVSRVSTSDSTLGATLNDWLIVLGVRIGPVTARPTEPDLKAI